MRDWILHKLNAATGHFYNHNRYYNPELGRYMEADPIGLEGGLNPYAYAGSNPVMNVDPSGLDMVPLSFQQMGNTFVTNGHLTQAIDNFERNLSQIKLNQPPYQSPSILAPTPKYTSNGKNYYRTMDEAGIAAIQGINPTSIKLGMEFAGLISFSSLGYSYSSPSSGNIDTSYPLLSYPSSNGILVGNYHTHGSWTPSYGKGNEYFSKSDRGFSIYAQALYLGTPTGAIKKWMPSWNYQWLCCINIQKLSSPQSIQI